MEKVLELRRKLASTQPAHDTPLGRLHPYWARKPLNIIRQIIKTLSSERDFVLDPFMGCGTTVFGCLFENRNVIASDINPLSSLIVEGSLNLCKKPQEQLSILSEFVEAFRDETTPWYSYNSGENIIERERYCVKGQFENGDFKLIPQEFILKTQMGNRFGNRKSISRRDIVFEERSKRFESFLSSPINFEKYKLTANSRIAIPRGALLSHYFTSRNRASINYAMRLIEKTADNDGIRRMLKFFLSSSLSLLRLSDYKASSQWPYWRPKEKLTSRTPIFIFNRRLEEFKKAQKWLLANTPMFQLNEFGRNKENKQFLQVIVKKASIQEIRKQSINKKVDLVLTDPPYGDQVPYLEYSSLWINSLGLSICKNDYEEEIVKTDAKGRQIHASKYLNKLLLSLDICAEVLKEGGYLAWFYQDPLIQNWAALHKKSTEIGLQFKIVIPLPKQRRSMKTVTTPGKTFDGDLLLIFQKKENGTLQFSSSKELKRGAMQAALKNIKSSNSSFFSSYSRIIQKSFEQGWIDELASRYSDFRAILG